MWPFKRKTFKPEPVFTGNCMVRQHTGDGDFVGRCYHSTYDGRCHVHGDVSAYLELAPIGEVLGAKDVWPNDHELEPNQ